LWRQSKPVSTQCHCNGKRAFMKNILETSAATRPVTGSRVTKPMAVAEMYPERSEGQTRGFYCAQ
jgi:hypothetical protein